MARSKIPLPHFESYLSRQKMSEETAVLHVSAVRHYLKRAGDAAMDREVRLRYAGKLSVAMRTRFRAAWNHYERHLNEGVVDLPASTASVEAASSGLSKEGGQEVQTASRAASTDKAEPTPTEARVASPVSSPAAAGFQMEVISSAELGHDEPFSMTVVPAVNPDAVNQNPVNPDEEQ